MTYMQSSSATRLALVFALAISLSSNALALPTIIPSDALASSLSKRGEADGGLTTGAVIGIVVGGCAALVIVVMGFFYWRSKSGKKNPFNDATVWMGSSNMFNYDRTPANDPDATKPAKKVYT